MTSFTPNPDYAKKLKAEKDERDCKLAVDVLKLAIEAAARHPEAKTAEQITQDAETYWQWVTGE